MPTVIGACSGRSATGAESADTRFIEVVQRTALRIARKVARSTGTLLAGDICNTSIYGPDDAKSHRQAARIFDDLLDTVGPLVQKRGNRLTVTCGDGVETMTLAVMGCVVNGPGESKAANIGISLPGTGEAPSCPVYIDCQKFTTLKGTHEELSVAFRKLVDEYVDTKYAKKEAT